MSEIRYTVGAGSTTVTIADLPLGRMLQDHCADSRPALLVADSNTITLCAEYDGPSVVLPCGESAKQWEAVAAILGRAVEIAMPRDGRIIGVGGGVVCDVAAFAASIYLRGVSLTLAPTTLLAMVDAAFGGKTGINFGGYKNMVGSFYPAAQLLVAPSAVASLPEREYRSGLAEVIKSAMLADADLFRFLEESRKAVLEREPGAVRTIVERSLVVKASVVERDFNESGIRAWLNLGHTFAHALETVTGFGTYTHGEAVAWGMICALELGVALGLTERHYAARATSLIEAYGFATRADGWDPERLLQAMRHDKKVQSGAVRFVLQRGLGENELTSVPDDAVRGVLRART